MKILVKSNRRSNAQMFFKIIEESGLRKEPVLDSLFTKVTGHSHETLLNRDSSTGFFL